MPATAKAMAEADPDLVIAGIRPRRIVPLKGCNSHDLLLIKIRSDRCAAHSGLIAHRGFPFDINTLQKKLGSVLLPPDSGH